MLCATVLTLTHKVGFELFLFNTQQRHIVVVCVCRCECNVCSTYLFIIHVFMLRYSCLKRTQTEQQQQQQQYSLGPIFQKNKSRQLAFRCSNTAPLNGVQVLGEMCRKPNHQYTLNILPFLIINL